MAIQKSVEHKGRSYTYYEYGRLLMSLNMLPMVFFGRMVGTRVYYYVPPLLVSPRAPRVPPLLVSPRAPRRLSSAYHVR